MNNHEQSPIVRLGLGIGAFFFVLGGPICGFFLTRIFLEARASSNWPSVMGMLTKAEVAQTSVGRFYGDVAYSYRVGDDEFSGTKIRASDGEYDFRDGAVQAISGLAVGKPIRVYYNPSDPQQALLHSGAGFQESVLLLVPIGMFGMGVWAFWRLWQTRRLPALK